MGQQTSASGILGDSGNDRVNFLEQDASEVDSSRLRVGRGEDETNYEYIPVETVRSGGSRRLTKHVHDYGKKQDDVILGRDRKANMALAINFDEPEKPAGFCNQSCVLAFLKFLGFIFVTATLALMILMGLAIFYYGSKVSSQEKEITDLRKIQSDLQLIVSNHSGDVEKNISEIEANLTARAADFQQKMDDLNAQLEKIKSTNVNLTADSKEMLDELEKLSSQFPEKLKNLSIDLNQKLSDVNETSINSDHAFEKDLNDTIADIADIREQIAELKSELNDTTGLDSEVKDLKKQADALKKRVDSKESFFTAEDRRLQRLNESLMENEKDLEKMQRSLYELTFKIGEATGKAEQLHSAGKFLQPLFATIAFIVAALLLN